MFKKIKKYFEIKYWYRWRILNKVWYNEVDNKYYTLKEKYFPKYKAKNVLESTQNGEYDLWQIILLKLDHMFWDLHKQGIETKYYFYNSDIEKYATEKDKIFLAKKVLESTLFNNQEFWIKNISIKNNIINIYLSLENNKISLNFELNKNNKIILDNWTLSFNKERALDQLLDQVNILLNKRIKDYLKENYNIEWQNISILDLAISNQNQYCNSIEIEEMPKISKELKKHAAGNFVKCKQILQLRKLVKKFLNFDIDNKFDFSYIDLNNNIKRDEIMLKENVAFKEEREKLYREIMNYMIEYSINWWN